MNYNSKFLGNMPPVVRGIIITNVAMLLITILAKDFMYQHFSLFYIESLFFKPYQFVTHIFMHGSPWHLLFNMYALWLFGCALEYQWGSKKFLSFYLSTGIGAALFYTVVLWLRLQYAESQIDTKFLIHSETYINIMRNPMVGASGAVYGVLLGFGMLYPNMVLRFIFPPIEMKAKWVVLGYGAIELFLGFANSGGNIAHFAHIGGMLFGFLMIKYWQKKGKMYF